MGKKTLTNAHCLLDLIEKAPVAVLHTFSGLPECQALTRGFDWSQDADGLAAGLIEHVRHLRKDHRDPAEREALRILRLASPRGAQILVTVADQLNDNDLFATFMAQDGGEIGRSVWMRTHSDNAARLFDVAESILNTGDIRGNKRLYDAFDVPCDEAPPFIWNETVKKELEAQLTSAMRLGEPCEVVYVPLADEKKNGDIKTTHYLVVRFAGDQVTAVQVVNRNRKSFFYFPARDATLVYAPDRKVVEVYAHTLSTRAPLANVLSKHGFKMPLSNRPLNRSRYDLSRFALPLKDEKPRLDGVKVERLYLTEAKALLGHCTDAVSLHIDSGAELHEIISERWNTQTRAGTRIDKKYLHKLLRNRIYLGELSHKGSWYPGVHQAIIDPGLWGRVHEVLAKDGHTRSVETKIRSRTDALLRGLLYAPSGERMYPTYSRKNGRKYHYYVSKSEARFGAPGKSYERLPAPEIEGAVMAQIRTVLTSPETVASVVRHIQRNGAQVDEATTVMAMGRLNNVWDQLFPVERHRIANLMIERIDLVHAGEVQEIKVKWREVGWNALIAEFAPDSIGAELLEVEA